MKNEILLNRWEAASALGVSGHTVDALAELGIIPCVYDRSGPRFSHEAVSEWLKSENPVITGKPDVGALREKFLRESPDALAALKRLDSEIAPKRGRGFCFQKVPSRKYGFLYYVRYVENGKVIPSRWNTRTNNMLLAEKFAAENKEGILSNWHLKHDKNDRFYSILKNYYKPGSEYMVNKTNRGGGITEQSRITAWKFVTNRLIPYLHTLKLENLNDLLVKHVLDFQNRLLLDGMCRQTVNRYMSPVREAFDYLVLQGMINQNVFRSVRMFADIKEKERGCYEIGDMRGVFLEDWGDTLDYLLCAVI
jgi:hypothetical protein